MFCGLLVCLLSVEYRLVMVTQNLCFICLNIDDYSLTVILMLLIKYAIFSPIFSMRQLNSIASGFGGVRRTKFSYGNHVEQIQMDAGTHMNPYGICTLNIFS